MAQPRRANLHAPTHAVVLQGSDSVPSTQREQMVTRLLDELRRTNTPGQCQGEAGRRACFGRKRHVWRSILAG